MGLAVSYTNEGYDSTAYRTLERWLSVKYPTILDPKETAEDDQARSDGVRCARRHERHHICAVILLALPL